MSVRLLVNVIIVCLLASAEAYVTYHSARTGEDGRHAAATFAGAADLLVGIVILSIARLISAAIEVVVIHRRRRPWLIHTRVVTIAVVAIITAFSAVLMSSLYVMYDVAPDELRQQPWASNSEITASVILGVAKLYLILLPVIAVLTLVASLIFPGRAAPEDQQGEAPSQGNTKLVNASTRRMGLATDIGFVAGVVSVAQGWQHEWWKTAISIACGLFGWFMLWVFSRSSSNSRSS